MAGTITLVAHDTAAKRRAIRVDWVGDASDGTVPSLTLPSLAGDLLAIETNPGATAPTASYDIAVNDQHGHDVLQGVGANRSASATEKAAIVFSGTSVHPPVVESDTLTLAISGNSVASATGTVVLYYGTE